MAEFKAFCELVDSCFEQGAELEKDQGKAHLWFAFDASVKLLQEKAARFESRANELDPDKRIYGPGMTVRVKAQVARVLQLTQLHAAIVSSRVVVEEKSKVVKAMETEEMHDASGMEAMDSAIAKAAIQKAVVEHNAIDIRASATTASSTPAPVPLLVSPCQSALPSGRVHVVSVEPQVL